MGSTLFTPLQILRSFVGRRAFSSGPLVPTPPWTPTNWPGIFDIRQLWESHKTESLTRTDRDLLRAGDKRFQGALFESLYQKWWAGTVSQSDLEVHFGDSRSSKKTGFSTHLLPDNYDIFRSSNSAPLRPAFVHDGSNSRSTSGL